MESSRFPCWAGVMMLALGLLLSGPAGAQDRLTVELNQLEDVDEGCRGSVVFTNLLDVPLRELAVEVAVFDDEGHVSNLWLLPARRMPPGQVRVRQFMFQDGPCEGIGHVLLNDVVTCDGDGIDAAHCLGVIEASSRTDVPFRSTVDAAGNDD